MNEQQPHTNENTDTNPEAEQRYKTLAVRLEEGLHAKLRFIAQLSDTSIAEEIRLAVQARITAAQDDPELAARAEQVRQEIEREAATRAAAIAGFLGGPAVAEVVAQPTATKRRTQRTEKE